MVAPFQQKYSSGQFVPFRALIIAGTLLCLRECQVEHTRYGPSIKTAGPKNMAAYSQQTVPNELSKLNTCCRVPVQGDFGQLGRLELFSGFTLPVAFISKTPYRPILIAEK